jgi:saccharopine dehydrogenase-like NADP-dependent oxidoreductase
MDAGLAEGISYLDTANYEPLKRQNLNKMAVGLHGTI